MRSCNGFWSSVLSVCVLVGCALGISVLIGCVPMSSTSTRPHYRERRAVVEQVAVRSGNVSESDNLKVSLLGYNSRQWQPAEMQNFAWPVKWLRGEKLGEQIYVVKQIGESFLFCLVSPGAVQFAKSKAMTEYTLFLVQKSSREEPSGQSKLLQVNDVEVRQMKLADEDYWTAPNILVKVDGTTFEVVEIYKGVSRSYAERLMNKFPWRAWARH